MTGILRERNEITLESAIEKPDNVCREIYMYICSRLQEKIIQEVQRKTFIPFLDDSSWRMEKCEDKI